MVRKPGLGRTWTGLACSLREGALVWHHGGLSFMEQVSVPVDTCRRN